MIHTLNRRLLGDSYMGQNHDHAAPITFVWGSVRGGGVNVASGKNE